MGGVSWPFVGRQREVDTALAVLDGPGVLVVAGEAGVGKSRFARELLTDVRGPTAVTAASASSRSIPLGAFAPFLPADGAPAGGLVAALAALRALGPDAVVLVDDAHLLDDVSATVVGQLAAERAVRLVVVVRSGEQAPAAITALWKDGVADRLTLTPLAPEPAELLLRRVLGGALDAGAGGRLVAAGHGNVLWLRHLVDGERAAGRLATVDGVWHWTGPGALGPALSELVDARIGTLSAPERRVLELVGLAEPIGLDLLTRLGDVDAVEELSVRGLLDVAVEGARREVRLGHPLYGEAVRARMGAPRARRLSGQLAAAIGEAGARRAGDVLRRAVLGLDGDRAPDPDVLVGAATVATGLGDFVLSERLWRAACAAGGGVEARLGLGQLLAHRLRVDEADAELARAVDEARGEDDLVRAAATHAVFLFFMTARADEAVATLDTTAQRTGPRSRSAFAGIRACLAVARGDFAGARQQAGIALDDEKVPDIGLTCAIWGAAHARVLEGRGDDLHDLVERGLTAARRSPETAAIGPILGFCEIVDADLRGEVATAAVRLAWVHGLTGAGAATIAAIYDGRMALTAGRPEEAVRLLGGAAVLVTSYGGGWGVRLRAMIAQCHGMLGDAAAARRALAEAEALVHPGVTMMAWELDLARAWTAAAEGAVADTRRRCTRAADDAHTAGAFAVEVLMRQTAVRFGDRGQAPRLRELATVLDTPRARLADAHARALARSDAAGLLAVATELDEAGLTLESADAAAQGALVARAAGDLVGAAAAEARARTLARAGDGARTPAVVQATAPLPVTGREREIARQAAEGLTNRQIADRLSVSVRTVESHVYRACSRLGLADRSALVALVSGASRS